MNIKWECMYSHVCVFNHTFIYGIDFSSKSQIKFSTILDFSHLAGKIRLNPCTESWTKFLHTDRQSKAQRNSVIQRKDDIHEPIVRINQVPFVIFMNDISLHTKILKLEYKTPILKHLVSIHIIHILYMLATLDYQFVSVCINATADTICNTVWWLQCDYASNERQLKCLFNSSWLTI